jgi:succinyl-diaminopimelate desuccinylase
MSQGFGNNFSSALRILVSYFRPECRIIHLYGALIEPDQGKMNEEFKMDYLPILENLVAFDTSVPPGHNYKETLDYLEPFFKQSGFQTQQIEIPPDHAEGRTGRVNLVCHRANPGLPHLIFYAHIDVVPAQGWPAFKPRLEQGKLFGRGSADMKGAIPALLMALDKGRNQAFNYDVSVMITTDEEFSQASQLRYISRFLEPLKEAYFFDLDSNFGYVSIANLGALQMDILVKGRSVHSGLSHLGENAVEKAVFVLEALLKLKSKVTSRKSRILTHPETGLDRMTARLNINMIQGGLKVNIIPDQCVISIDRRLIPEENLTEARKEIIDTLATVQNVNWEIVREYSIPTLPPCEDPVTDKLADILREVTGESGKYGEMGSGDLANIVVNEWKGKEFGMGVIRTQSNIHGINEFVYLKDIEDLSKIIYRFLTK